MSIHAPSEREFLYEQIAARMTQLIDSGTLKAGEKLPSVRKLSRQEKVSVSTVLQAYYWLESRGRIEAHPQSGFYVSTRSDSLPEPGMSSPRCLPSSVGVDDLISRVFDAARDPDIVPLGAAVPSPELFPNRKLSRMLSAVARRDPDRCNLYDVAPGDHELRRQIARRSLTWGGALSVDDLVVTSGCMEALNLCLRAVTLPGDIVAVEAPTYFGVLQIIETLGLKALEIRTHPRRGMCLDALEAATEQDSVKACVLNVNCHNPLGGFMADEKKQAMVDLLARKEIPLIEDDIFGDLWFGKTRPKACKAFDKKGLVMMCSSFTKTVMPGYRIGWTAPGRFVGAVTRLKRASTVGNATVPQLVLAEFLETGRYDHHLRGIKKIYASNIHAMSHAIGRYFPPQTRVTRPEGGSLLWLELPARVDALELHRRAIQESIGIAPGPIFSASGGFRNFIRLNAGVRWSDRIEQAVMILGRLTTELERSPS